jgi:hypothetical protein
MSSTKIQINNYFIACVEFQKIVKENILDPGGIKNFLGDKFFWSSRLASAESKLSPTGVWCVIVAIWGGFKNFIAKY